MFLQPPRELYLLNIPHNSRKRYLKKSFYLLTLEAATGKCHLKVTRRRKPNRNAAVVAIQAFVIHVVALLSSAHSPLCQLRLLHFYPLHQNIKSVDLYFFWSKFHLGQNGQIPQALQQRGSSQLRSLCFTHAPHPLSVSPQHAACRGCQGPAAGTSCIRDGAWSKCHILFQGQLSELPPNTDHAGSISRDRRAEGLAGHTTGRRGHVQGQVCFPELSLQWSSSVSPLSISTR